jgi:hypothetical protein
VQPAVGSGTVAGFERYCRNCRPAVRKTPSRLSGCSTDGDRGASISFSQGISRFDARSVADASRALPPATSVARAAHLWSYSEMAPTRDRRASLVELVGKYFGRSVASARPVAGGYSQAERLVVHWHGGGSAFVKGATDPDTAGWLRSEHAIYERYRADFLPELLGWQDDGAMPWMALEDLSEASWPPPWSRARIDAVLATLTAVASSPASQLPSLETHRNDLVGWPLVAANPDPFLKLGVVTEAWLARALPTLRAAEDSAVLDGDSLLHNDVRSDNLCFVDERVVFVDWNWACRGNPKLDIAAWLPSLALEGGPPPEAILPSAEHLASLIAGFYAAHAGLPPLDGRPTLRTLQLGLLQQSLAWAARALGLAAPDGPRAE